MPQLYQMTIVADGEVRDKDGNVKDSGPIEAVAYVTEEQVAAILAAHHQEETP